MGGASAGGVGLLVVTLVVLLVALLVVVVVVVGLSVPALGGIRFRGLFPSFEGGKLLPLVLP